MKKVKINKKELEDTMYIIGIVCCVCLLCVEPRDVHEFIRGVIILCQTW